MLAITVILGTDNQPYNVADCHHRRIDVHLGLWQGGARLEVGDDPTNKEGFGEFDAFLLQINEK